MIQISLELIIGMIGAITGVISLIWHISKDRPNLKLESAYFEWKNKHEKNPPEREFIMVKINLRNLSKLSTTIEDIYVYIGNNVLTPQFFMPSSVNIKGHSSKSLGYVFNFEKEEFKKLFDDKGEIRLGFLIVHTFGSIQRRRNITFETGWFNLK